MLLVIAATAIVRVGVRLVIIVDINDKTITKKEVIMVIVIVTIPVRKEQDLRARRGREAPQLN